jgi:tetratricopeptide (TPR) repeat protein
VQAERLLAQGRAEEALAMASEALSAKEALDLSHTTVKRGLVLAAEAALALEDVAKAEAMLGIVGSARPGAISPCLRGQSARLAARLAALQGLDDASVEPGFLAAEREFHSLEMPWDLAIALVEHGEWLAGRGRLEEAEGVAQQARELFERLGAGPSIERASRLVGVQAGASA